MDVAFASKKLQKTCNSEKELKGVYGDRMAAKIMTRLLDLRAAATLEVMRHLPGRCHELRGDRAGQLALHLVEPVRLVFRPVDDPPPRNESGTLIWGEVTSVIVLGIGDYHN